MKRRKLLLEFYVAPDHSGGRQADAQRWSANFMTNRTEAPA